MNESPKADQKTQHSQLESAKINQALGLFLFAFGIIILVAVFFTPTNLGKVINLVSALILCLFGGGMILHSRRKNRIHR